MKVLGIGDTNDLGSLYLTLAREGHEVRVYIGDEAAHDTLGGMVDRVDDWRPAIDWIRAAGNDGLVLFETAHHGELQDELRASGLAVVGGSAWGDRLESDRGFGQTVMRDAGMQVARSWSFDGFDDAIAWVTAHPARYVYKLSGSGFASTRTFVGELPNAVDMLGYLALQRRSWTLDEPARITLMERLGGVEVGVGAYFDGQRFLSPACLDWEHKRFFPGDLGELTGEMGTLVTYRRAERLFAETLGRMTDRLREGGYRGYINVNTMVDDRGVWPLEFTCRFGYPGFAILQPLQTAGWVDLFRRMHGHGDATFATAEGYAVGIVLTVPPFPQTIGYAELSKGLPVTIGPELTEADREHLHPNEIARVDGQLVTSGTAGYVMVVTGTGPTAPQAHAEALRRIDQVYVPKRRYRRDIGEKFTALDEALLQRWGWL